MSGGDSEQDDLLRSVHVLMGSDERESVTYEHKPKELGDFVAYEPQSQVGRDNVLDDIGRLCESSQHAFKQSVGLSPLPHPLHFLYRGKHRITYDYYLISSGKATFPVQRVRLAFKRGAVCDRSFEFNLSTRSVFSNIARFFGKKEIEVGSAEFTKTFVLKTNHPEVASKLFQESPRVCDELLEVHRHTVWPHHCFLEVQKDDIWYGRAPFGLRKKMLEMPEDEAVLSFFVLSRYDKAEVREAERLLYALTLVFDALVSAGVALPAPSELTMPSLHFVTDSKAEVVT